jgi:hypothetical protein
MFISSNADAAMMLTGRNLLDYCSAPKDTPQELICKAYLKGAYEMQLGLQLQAQMLTTLANSGRHTVEPPSTGICIPTNASSDEIYSVAIASLRTNSLAADIMTAGQMLGEAWRNKWPCQSHLDRLKELNQLDLKNRSGQSSATTNGGVQ